MVTKERATNLARKLLTDDFIRVNKGLNNWVFERGSQVLTLPRHKRVKEYRIRVAAIIKLEENGIPVAKILDYSPSKNGEPEYLIVEKIDGENVDLSKKIKSERDKIHQSTGEILKSIHSIRVEGFGRLDPDLVGKYGSWVDFVDFFFEDSFKRLERNEELLKKYGDTLRREYDSNRIRAQELNSGVFLHADYHLGNLLFKNNRVVSVLDLDIVTSGDQNWDTGHYSHTFNVDREGGLDSFRKGYGSDRNHASERLYSIAIWTRKIGSQAVDRPEALRESILELNKILEEK